jgi:hypothetical protein
MLLTRSKSTLQTCAKQASKGKLNSQRSHNNLQALHYQKEHVVINVIRRHFSIAMPHPRLFAVGVEE